MMDFVSWEGWHPIYEMENKFHLWKHQPGISIVTLKLKVVWLFSSLFTLGREHWNDDTKRRFSSFVHHVSSWLVLVLIIHRTDILSINHNFTITSSVVILVHHSSSHVSSCFLTCFIIWLVVDLPLWKIWKSVGMMKFPIYIYIYIYMIYIYNIIWKNKINVPNHQPVMFHHCSSFSPHLSADFPIPLAYCHPRACSLAHLGALKRHQSSCLRRGHRDDAAMGGHEIHQQKTGNIWKLWV